MGEEEPVNLTSPTAVRNLLAELGHRPNKGLGQNYLIDANILDIIAKTAAIEPEEQVLEIGPGLGALTERLLPLARRVVCIEKDPTMAAYLKSRFPALELIEADALDVNLQQLLAGGITKVAANLPYSVASRLMVDLAECESRPERMSLTIQKEVADRLTADPGGKNYGVLTVLTGAFYNCSLAKKISPNCFLPPPKVWSAVVKMERYKTPIVSPVLYLPFKKLVKTCFSQRRKQLGTILRKSGYTITEEQLAAIGLNVTVRPERVTVPQWASLASCLV